MSVLLLAFLVATLVGCSPSRQPVATKKVTIAAATFPASASVFVADEKGFFTAEGLDPAFRTYAAGKLALEAALDGKADFATVAETPIAAAVLSGKKPMVVATICEIDDSVVVVARRDRGISTAADLRGKRIGVLPGTTADFFQHIYLVTSGIDPSTVTLVPLTAADLVSSLASGSVDAISAFSPNDFQAEERLGANAVILGDPTLYTTTWNVAIRPEFATTERDTVVRFLRAILKANDYIAAHPSEAQAITSKRTGVPVETLQKQWSNNHWTMKLDDTLILALEDEWRWMTAGRKATPDFLQNVDTSALKVVRPGAVGLIEPKD